MPKERFTAPFPLQKRCGSPLWMSGLRRRGVHLTSIQMPRSGSFTSDYYSAPAQGAGRPTLNLCPARNHGRDSVYAIAGFLKAPLTTREAAVLQILINFRATAPVSSAEAKRSRRQHFGRVTAHGKVEMAQAVRRDRLDSALLAR